MVGGRKRFLFLPQKYFQVVHTHTRIVQYFKTTVKPLPVCLMNPFIFSTHLRAHTHTHTRNVNIPFGVFLKFKSPAPFLSLSLSPEASRISISPPVCVRACGGLSAFTKSFIFPSSPFQPLQLYFLFYRISDSPEIYIGEGEEKKQFSNAYIFSLLNYVIFFFGS